MTLLGWLVLLAIVLWCAGTVVWDMRHKDGEQVSDYDPYAARRSDWINQ